MSAQEPQAIKLSDYRPPLFRVESVNLTLDIHEEHTLVTAQLDIRRCGEGSDLELLGENLEMVSLKLEGAPVAAGAYTLSADKFVLHGIKGDRISLEIQNKIRPDKNTALEGFYQSGDIYCTQCEPEGFRKITWFTDRPDVMARYTTTLIADQRRFPLLLSNGNRVAAGQKEGGRHFVTWVDPFPKPSYLFAAVAGDLELAQDTYTTRSGRKVALEVYVDKGQGHKTAHALHSLKNAMRWDEETFGLEYDLDIYMIVAVESFNFGAMENKGLNIFNSAFVLADPESATDSDFQNVEGVVGHEYFHNWTGNRVTCRDWFQLTLKEGLTVFRDQEFSADMLSRPVKRIEDVKRLREMQFSEDAGPLSHPIRPSSYIEINNFYTATVYEKGAEVIRMIHTLIGDKHFKAGITEYFHRYDGQAVTTDDFVSAMEAASGRDLTQFKNWYSRPGTPTLVVQGTYDVDKAEYRLNVRQKYPMVGRERLNEDNVLHVPFKVALFDNTGRMVGEERVLELKRLEETFTFTNVLTPPVPSLNRSFAAPVHVDFAYTQESLLHLVAHDTDPVSRYEALQRVYTTLLENWVSSGELPQSLPENLMLALEKILKDDQLDPAFKAYLFDLPSESQLHQGQDKVEVDGTHAAVKRMYHLVGAGFAEEWKRLYQRHIDSRAGDVSAEACAGRALKNRSLQMLMRGKVAGAESLLASHLKTARTMTEEAIALNLYCAHQPAGFADVVRAFRSKWKHEPLVMLRWFGAQAAYARPEDAIARMEELEKDSCFRAQVPNDIRGLYQSFSRSNLVSFHRLDGAGYRFLAERICQVDSFNPQVASRLTGAFAMLPKMDGTRRGLMQEALKSIVGGNPSKDVFEVASRYLGQA